MSTLLAVNKKLTRWFLPLILALLGIFAIVAPVLASVSQPDSLEIQEVVAYENYYEEDAQLYIITYLIDYDSTPSQDADETFLFQLLDADDDVVATKAPFPFYNDGYGLGVVAFYLDASEAPTWGGNASIRLVGNPMVDWVGGIPSTTTDVITWNTDTTEEIRELVSAKVLALAADLEETWDVDMVTTTGGNTKLTDDGAIYFTNVIPYLTTEVPAVFGQYTFAPDYPEDKPSENAYSNFLEESIEGTIFDLSGPARSLGISRGALTAFFWYGFVVALFILLISKDKLNKGTMLLAWPFVIGGAFFGIPLVVTIVGGFICLISTAWVFYKGTST